MKKTFPNALDDLIDAYLEERSADVADITLALKSKADALENYRAEVEAEEDDDENLEDDDEESETK